MTILAQMAWTPRRYSLSKQFLSTFRFSLCLGFENTVRISVVHILSSSERKHIAIGNCRRNRLIVLEARLINFGTAIKIIFDRDPKFPPTFRRILMRLLDVKLGLTAAFRPAADGQSKRTNETMEIALQCFLSGDVDKYPLWDEVLPNIVEHDYNTTRFPKILRLPPLLLDY
jgi:hypothetical protein